MLLLLQFPHNTNEILSTYLRTLALRTCTTQNFSHLQKNKNKNVTFPFTYYYSFPKYIFIT